MAYKDLQDFMAALEAKGQLKRITVEVDPELEITEIADRVMRQSGGGPALLFEKVKGSAYPLLINAMGSEERMAMAFGASFHGPGSSSAASTCSRRYPRPCPNCRWRSACFPNGSRGPSARK